MEGGDTIIAAKGVMLGTGGYDWNVELARGLEGLPDLVPMGPESLTGDGLILGAEVGAIIHRIQNSLFLMLGYAVPSAEPGKPPVIARVLWNCSLPTPWSLIERGGGSPTNPSSRESSRASVNSTP
jgi:hypothetical protein